MENKINIIANTLEQMLADAEDNGRDGIQPMLTPEDVKDILRALNFTDAQEKCCCGETEGRKPFSFAQRELSGTVSMMNSPDYKERFKAEYIQTKIRYERLKAFNNKIEAAIRERDSYSVCLNARERVVEPKHDCPRELLCEQQDVMRQYLHVLEIRAVIEGVDLG